MVARQRQDCIDQRQLTIELRRRKGRYRTDASYLLSIRAALIVINKFNAVLARSMWPLVPANEPVLATDCIQWFKQRKNSRVSPDERATSTDLSDVPTASCEE
jgi:hypothetical protein